MVLYEFANDSCLKSEVEGCLFVAMNQEQEKQPTSMMHVVLCEFTNDFWLKSKVQGSLFVAMNQEQEKQLTSWPLNKEQQKQPTLWPIVLDNGNNKYHLIIIISLDYFELKFQ